MAKNTGVVFGVFLVRILIVFTISAAAAISAVMISILSCQLWFARGRHAAITGVTATA